MEVVVEAIYLLNFYAGSSMCPDSVWIISGLRRRRKNVTAPAPQLFFSWTWLQLRTSWSSWVWTRLRSSLFHGSGWRSGFCSFSHNNILIVLMRLKLNRKWI